MNFSFKKVIRLLLALVLLFETTYAWEWSDFIGSHLPSPVVATLSLEEVSDLRARDIKRRLARNHGYSAEELARILDKKELIHALAFEEEKIRLKYEDEVKRVLLKRGIITAILLVLVIVCWPLLQHAYEVASVNFVVYTDRKRHEAHRCWELKSYAGMVGCTIMFVLDLMQAWLTASILLSWVMRSRYFFPTPSLPIKPGQLMGGEIARSPMANYGLNVGPMAVSWGMRFVYGRIESWTGRALSRAHQTQRRAARDNESEQERAARKARKQARREERERQAAMRVPTSTLPPDWMQPNNNDSDERGEGPAPFSTVHNDHTVGSEDKQYPLPSSKEHEEFLEQLDCHVSEFDELD
ncbi:hypothetical protein FisN_22Hu098 [Fistulifera solaris]|jgi:hypothetical protein|uniref:Uncharacterized protein n=1 Tax=Fistulifera solaris TaxID=1519565 RepID=A0A1Z5JPW1_FISSO|nr:hypothetical protein FisN_22Hu098 [Fistulifera solaris]|eukprot:GAX16044.1 hypothetical protein FisN_22Hu098 [Fistulifera solaris]